MAHAAFVAHVSLPWAEKKLAVAKLSGDPESTNSDIDLDIEFGDSVPQLFAELTKGELVSIHPLKGFGVAMLQVSMAMGGPGGRRLLMKSTLSGHSKKDF